MSSLAARRVSGFLAICIFFAIATVLLLADRSASLVGDVLGVFVNTGREIEQTYNIDVLDRGDIPGTFDQIGHAVLWGGGMLVVGFASRFRVPVPLTALFMGGASLAFEMAQPVLSATRVFEPSDAVGNIVGIVLATIVLSASLWISGRLSRLAIARTD